MDQELKQEFESLGRMIKEGFDQTATKGELESLKGDLESVKEDLASVKEDLASVKEDLTRVENQMVTKDYLDEKLADLRGDITILIRKEDRKVLRLIEILKEKGTLTSDEVKELFSMEPFPRLTL